MKIQKTYQKVSDRQKLKDFDWIKLLLCALILQYLIKYLIQLSCLYPQTKTLITQHRSPYPYTATFKTRVQEWYCNDSIIPKRSALINHIFSFNKLLLDVWALIGSPR